MGSMSYLRLSVHSPEYIWLRHFFLQKRNELGLSQRALSTKLGVENSFVGKVETGDRRLDVFEFISYCEALEIDAAKLIEEINHVFSKE